jgi:opacity protein-like surface antigen
MGTSPERLVGGARPVFSRLKRQSVLVLATVADCSLGVRTDVALAKRRPMHTTQVRLLRWTKLFLMLASVSAALAVAPPADAEWFVDLYLGGAFTEKHDVEFDSNPGKVTTLDVKFDESFAGGIRGGYWFPFDLGPINFGAGLDLSHFRPNIGRQTRVVCSNVCVNGVFDDFDVWVWSVGIDAMLRFPLLKSSKFPHGQLQPYITVGPTVFVAHAEDHHNFAPGNQTNNDTALGVKVAGGVAWNFTPGIAMFGEYRYTHFSPEWTINSTDISTDINTHYVLVGVSFRF